MNKSIQTNYINFIEDNLNILYYPIKQDNKNKFDEIVAYNNKYIGFSIYDQRDINGNIPLHYSIMFDKIAYFNLLLPFSNCNAIDINGNNALMLVMSNNIHNKSPFYSLIPQTNLSIKNKDGNNAFHLAILHNEYNKIAKFIPPFLSLINTQNNQGFTPFMYMIIHWPQVYDNYKNIADLNIQNINGETPFHIMVKNKQKIDSVSNFANFNAVDNKLQTVLHLILLKNEQLSDEIMKTFLKNTNVNIPDTNGDTIMHLIAAKKNWKWFIEFVANPNINITNKKNISPCDINPELSKYFNNYPDFKLIKTKTHSKYTGSIYDINACLSAFIQKFKLATIDTTLNNEFVTFFSNEIVEDIEYFKQYDTHIVYFNDRLFIPSTLKNINTNNKLVIIPICIMTYDYAHSNILLINGKTKQMEHYEPYGNHLPLGLQIDSSRFYEQIKTIAKTLDLDYISPKSLPSNGLMFYEMREHEGKFNDFDYCFIWCLIYIEYRLKNPNIFRNDLILKLIETVANKYQYVTSYAHNIMPLQY